MPPRNFMPTSGGASHGLSLDHPDQNFKPGFESSTLPPEQMQAELLAKAKVLSTKPFPKKIWQTWKTISLPAEDDYKNANSWGQKNPSHEYELLTDKTAERYVIDNFNETDPYIVFLYRGFTQRILAVDLLRYLIAFKSGGIYTDLDTRCNEPIDTWLPEAIKHMPDVKESDINIIIGMELDVFDKEKYSDEWVKDSGFKERIQFVQWTIYAKPGHEILQRMITSIQERVREDIASVPSKSILGVRYSSMEVLDRTGPFRWTRIVQKYINQIENRMVQESEYSGLTEAKKFGDVLFLPVNKMSPGVPHSNAGPDETSFLIHEFKGVWRGTTE
ncbi:hypothetical protein ABW19_dt0206273 [Dactylella cylindrospora]|nr:hypothetical protein ABW19_dt0206273 [Dactylella cylindrospora]